MIFGTEKIMFEYTQNTHVIQFSPLKSVTVFGYNIPDILLQRAINGNVIKILRGYYHKFTVTVYGYTEEEQETMRLATHFYPHYVNSSSKKLAINSISQPFYVADINGFNAVTYIIETVGYEVMEVV